MVLWFPNEEKAQTFENASKELSLLYKSKLKPLENTYKFHDFHAAPLEDGYFSSKPIVLLAGQYSTGKTTFIKYFLQKEFPGMRIGPEPTTDCFNVVMLGEKDKSADVIIEGEMPGNALVADKSKPFGSMSSFGNAFLSRLKCSLTDSEVLKKVNFIDSPGILSGEKQRVKRGYNFAKVMKLLAERVDVIVLLFDAHKLDISDEFQEVINSIKEHHSKIRVVLNKADQVNAQQLMRVYGALMWSLGKVFVSPEVVRVFVGSFWDQPFFQKENEVLFKKEHKDLSSEIDNLPRDAVMRKLNDLVKRARLAKVHAYIISYLYSAMPYRYSIKNIFRCTDKIKEDLIDDLDRTYRRLAHKYRISLGDFPDVEEMKFNLRDKDFYSFRKLDVGMIKKVDDMLSKDIPKLIHFLKEPKDDEGGFEPGNKFVREAGKVQAKLVSILGQISCCGLWTRTALAEAAHRRLQDELGFDLPSTVVWSNLMF